MEYGLDLNTGQVVGWLKDDLAAGRRRKLQVRATREYNTEPVSDLDEAGIGEDQGVAVLTTTGTLEVWPTEVKHKWMLRIRVVDVFGSHLPEDESVPEDAEEIDLDAFYRDFVAPDRGTVSVTITSDTLDAKHAFDRILSEIITDRHAS